MAGRSGALGRAPALSNRVTVSSAMTTLDVNEQGRRLQALRGELSRRGLSAYLVPRSDEYMLEYVPPASERLAWLTGFSGSAGIAVVGREKAALFVDGRYTTQARSQARAELWEHHHVTDSPPALWLARTVGAGERVGYDPRVHTPASLKAAREACERIGAELIPVDQNLVDGVWEDRPREPASKIELYPVSISGESASSKRERMARELERERMDALVISAPENVAWMLNIRGTDVQHVPIALGRALLRADGTLELFMAPDRFEPGVLAALREEHGDRLSVESAQAFTEALRGLSALRVRVDATTVSEWIVNELKASGAHVDVGRDPCALAKACKTDQELAAIRSAHVRDGVAVLRFLAWLSQNAPGNHSEHTVSEKLAEFRAGAENYRGPSFDTISAFGPSSALPHYRASQESALPLEEGNLYLVDSGGQYLDGTTDITRVTCIGTPTAEMKRRYTQVLKGHIALARARFPYGTTGTQLDALARQYLWEDGVDFDHGTGHGVGCYLSVHEGPHGISKRPNDVALRPGMIVSNEPGYYKPGAFGIRIENLIAVQELSPQPAGAEIKVLGFETLTVVPYERRLIDLALLREEERRYIDDYHRRVRELLLPEVVEAAEYLDAATAPL